jgi:hypothetical protein
MRKLDKLINKHMNGNPLVVAALLEQAAKEMGDVYTNRRLNEMTGAGGGPIQTEEVNPLQNLTDEEFQLFREFVDAIHSGAAEKASPEEKAAALGGRLRVVK